MSAARRRRPRAWSATGTAATTPPATRTAAGSGSRASGPAAPGLERHWHGSYYPVRDEDGGVLGIAGLVLEVTGERAANLRADEALLRGASVAAELEALYAALPVGVAFLTPDLRYQRVNETLARMTGRSVAAYAGATLEQVLGPAAAPLTDALQAVLLERRPLELEVVMAPEPGGGQARTFDLTF